METSGGGGKSPRILNLGTRLRWEVASRPGRSSAGERAPGTHWILGWAGLRAGLDAVEKNKIRPTARNRTPVVQPVA
jgi:hypothetical protein